METNNTLKINSRHVVLFLITLVTLGGLIRFMFAYGEMHYFDLNYYITWANDVFKNGVFGAYTSMQGMELGVDYPPLFLFPLYITGAILNNPDVAAYDGNIMLAIKMWQVLFDLGIIIALYFILRKFGKIFALGAAALWCINPAIIFSSSYWGQTDSIMIFFLLVTFGAFYHKKPMLGTVLYALSCLTKFQCAYFAPLVILLILFSKYDFKAIVKSILAGIITVVAVFLPFMIHSGAALPIQIYFNGLGRWPYATMYSFNFMGALGLNYVEDSVKILPFLSANTFGSIMTILAVASMVLIFFTSKKRCPFILGFILMNTIFMFSSRMHERYQIPVMIFILVAAAIHKSGRLLVAYILTTIMVFVNHYIPFQEIVNRNGHAAPWMANIESILVTASVVNIIVYLITLFICLDSLYNLTDVCKTFIKDRKKEHYIDELSKQV